MPYQANPFPPPAQGVHQEIHPNDLAADALSDATNWLYRDGRMKVRAGFAQIGQGIAQRPMGFAAYVDRTGVPRLLMGTASSLWYFNATTQQWVDKAAGLTGGATEQAVFRAYEKSATTYAYMVNGKDANLRYDAVADTLTTMGGTPPVAKTMMIINDTMILGNCVTAGGGTGIVSPQAYNCSSPQNPDAGWGSVLVGLLADTPGDIVAMLEMGNLQGFAYKSDAIHGFYAQGATIPITQSLKQIVSGPCSRKSVLLLANGLHIYLAQDGTLRIFDGNESKSVGRHVQRYVLNNWDINAIQRVNGVYDPNNNCVWYFFNGIGSSDPNKGFVFDLDAGTLWPVSFDSIRVSASIKALLPGGTTLGSLTATAISALTLTLGEYDAFGATLLLGDANGMRTVKESGYTDSGAAITSFFQTGLTDFGDPLHFKSFEYIDHFFDQPVANQLVNVTLRHSDYGEDATSDAPVALTVASGQPRYSHHRVQSRRFGMRMDLSSSQDVGYQGGVASWKQKGVA